MVFFDWLLENDIYEDSQEGYSTLEFCEIVERHCDACRERGLKKMHFMFGDKNKFLRTLDFVKNDMIETSPSRTNPKWCGHNFPIVLETGADCIQSGNAVLWEPWDWVSYYIRRTYQ